MLNVKKPDAIPNKEDEQTSKADTGNLTKTLLFLCFVFFIFNKVGARSKAIHRQKWNHKKCSSNGSRPTTDLKCRCGTKNGNGRWRDADKIQSAQTKRASVPFDTLRDVERVC